MCEVYKNKDVIQTSLTKANGFKIGTSYYWSSSQTQKASDVGIYAYLVDFDDGTIDDEYRKNYDKSVFVLQALTAK